LPLTSQRFLTPHCRYTTQQQVFDESITPVLDEVLAGYNCTIFAYGQTGTGKTHTMEGQLSSDDTQNKGAGVIPRAVHSIFERLEASGNEFSVKVSFLELYNEELTDLFCVPTPGEAPPPLRIFEEQGKAGGMVVNNLDEIIVQDGKRRDGLNCSAHLCLFM
jgi:kinesin family protein 11